MNEITINGVRYNARPSGGRSPFEGHPKSARLYVVQMLANAARCRLRGDKRNALRYTLCAARTIPVGGAR
jgi:hypothetical protein